MKKKILKWGLILLAVIIVAGGSITVDVVMNITFADYGIAFEKGKPSKNIAKTVKASIKAVYN